MGRLTLLFLTLVLTLPLHAENNGGMKETILGDTLGVLHQFKVNIDRCQKNLSGSSCKMQFPLEYGHYCETDTRRYSHGPIRATFASYMQSYTMSLTWPSSEPKPSQDEIIEYLRKASEALKGTDGNLLLTSTTFRLPHAGEPLEGKTETPDYIVNRRGPMVAVDRTFQVNNSDCWENFDLSRNQCVVTLDHTLTVTHNSDESQTKSAQLSAGVSARLQAGVHGYTLQLANAGSLTEPQKQEALQEAVLALKGADTSLTVSLLGLYRPRKDAPSDPRVSDREVGIVIAKRRDYQISADECEKVWLGRSCYVRFSKAHYLQHPGEDSSSLRHQFKDGSSALAYGDPNGYAVYLSSSEDKSKQLEKIREAVKTWEQSAEGAWVFDSFYDVRP